MAQIELADPNLVLHFELLKRQVLNLKSYSVDSSYMTSTDGWEITIYDEDYSKLRGLELQPIEILLEGQQQLLGRVDQTERGGDGSSITLRGRDYIADLVECNVDPALKVSEKMILADVVKLAAGPVGITTVLDEDEGPDMRQVRTGKSLGGASKKKHGKKSLEDLKPQPDQGIYEFLHKILARHGATLQPALARNTVLLSSPNYTQAPAGRLHRVRDPDLSAGNNVLEGTASRDFSQFPTVALFVGKSGKPGETKNGMSQQYDFVTLSDSFNLELKSVLDMVYELRGDQARRKPTEPTGLGTGLLYRLLYHRDDESKNKDQLMRAAKRAIADRLKNTLQYRCRVRGHVDPETGAIWSINTMLQVQDEICDINEPLWVERRTFSNTGSGAVTELELWRPESFQIDVE